jgi:uncharacterized OsmC-like protein
MKRDLATALQRAEAALRRRPELGVHDDATAIAQWQGGTRIVSNHANGTQVESDMPAELGGSGDRVTPGWLFRAGLASCAATSIVMLAATEGVELSVLEVQANSRSDASGLLGIADADGRAIYPGPHDMALHVRVVAPAVAPERLRELVQTALGRSPIPNAVQCATELRLRIDTGDATS